MKTSVNKNCAVIPFYNEKRFIREIISDLLTVADVIIAVDDGSEDGSAEEIPENDRIIIITHPTNIGKGAALNSGFRKSIEIETQYTITIDADLQHPVSSIPQMLEKCSNYDIVIGNRMHSLENMPLPRRLSNFLTSQILTIKTGVKINDSQCGFRVYKTSVLKDILPSSNGFEAESEILVNAARNNLTIGSVNIPVIYGEEESKMKNIEAIKGFLKVVLTK
ncbi:MAG: glycosyltransferase family 2 protein [Ignavibacteria bacterium]|nr:glycosyltransferase family 2 protein [Ignavibacteria bacterium]